MRYKMEQGAPVVIHASDCTEAVAECEAVTREQILTSASVALMAGHREIVTLCLACIPRILPI